MINGQVECLQRWSANWLAIALAILAATVCAHLRAQGILGAETKGRSIGTECFTSDSHVPIGKENPVLGRFTTDSSKGFSGERQHRLANAALEARTQRPERCQQLRIDQRRPQLQGVIHAGPVAVAQQLIAQIQRGLEQADRRRSRHGHRHGSMPGGEPPRRASPSRAMSAPSARAAPREGTGRDSENRRPRRAARDAGTRQLGLRSALAEVRARAPSSSARATGSGGHARPRAAVRGTARKDEYPQNSSSPPTPGQHDLVAALCRRLAGEPRVDAVDRRLIHGAGCVERPRSNSAAGHAAHRDAASRSAPRSRQPQAPRRLAGRRTPRSQR